MRQLDVADDLAFLVWIWPRSEASGSARPSWMRTGCRGRPRPGCVIAFYAAYRALVRAKVALVRDSQLPSPSAKPAQRARARDLLALAERFAWRARRPLVIVVCGLPASGKSQLATHWQSSRGCLT